MAYIYRYRLENHSQKPAENLTHYSGEIEKVLFELFKENLKDYVVKETYFEFKLFISVPEKTLQEMGCRLHGELPNMGSFSRMEQKLYALVYQPQCEAESFSREDEDEDEDEPLAQEEDVYVEFIDAMVLDEPGEFSRRSREFFQKHRVGGNGAFCGDGVAKNFYVDILTAYLDPCVYTDFLDAENEISCFVVTGHHECCKRSDEIFRDNKNKSVIRLEYPVDVEALKRRQSVYHQIGDREQYSDVFVIHSVEKQNSLVTYSPD